MINKNAIHLERVYDMIGKLIKKVEVQLSAISDLQISDNYPIGVSNVIVKQGTNVETLRVIKRLNIF